MGLQVPPALKHPKYFYLWLGLLVSVAGSQMQLAAIHWHIRELTGEPNPLALGGIGLARMCRSSSFLLSAGQWLIVTTAAKILFITQSILAVQALVLAYLTFSVSSRYGISIF